MWKNDSIFIMLGQKYYSTKILRPDTGPFYKKLQLLRPLIPMDLKGYSVFIKAFIYLLFIHSIYSPTFLIKLKVS